MDLNNFGISYSPFKRLWRNHQPEACPPLLIFDDFFPHPFSSFRYAEFTGLLDAFTSASVHTTCSSVPHCGCNWNVSEVIQAHINNNPQDHGRIQPFSDAGSWEGRAVYCVFLMNIARIIDGLNRYRVPFAFTLYPGGSFLLDQPQTDEQLKRVFDSPYFRFVVVTQPMTRDYLLSKGLCDRAKIRFIYGGVLPAAGSPDPTARQLYGIHKKTIDVSFVAWRYMPQGRDKGYDRFVEMAKLLSRRFDCVRFHVVGPWSKDDVDISGLEGKFFFHGPMVSGNLKAFFRQIDLIVSPNLPFTLRPGKFDGFPTGCCVEAGLNGVAVCTTDELKQNIPLN